MPFLLVCIIQAPSCPSLSRTSLRRRLRLLLVHDDTACGLCGLTMETWGDHALSCICGGDRVTSTQYGTSSSLRHVNTPHPLLPGPPEEENRPPDHVDVCRVTELWVPRGSSGHPKAWDFSITDGLRRALFTACSFHPSSIFEAFERHKVHV